MKKPCRLISSAFISVFILHAAMAADKPVQSGPPPVQVTTAVVQQQAVPTYLDGTGSVTTVASVVVKARIDGQLDSVGFTEGQDVRAGQVLARIDPRTLQAQLAQVEAQRAKDQALLNNARIDLQRFTTLIAEDAATKQQLDTQKALVAQLEAAVQADEAQVKYAQVQLGFTTITSPISGRAGARLVDPGNIIKATDATGIVVINQIDPIAVVFTLPEAAFQAINQTMRGARTPLTVEAYPRDRSELLGRGKLVLVNNQIDLTSGTIQLKAHFPNAQHKLWPGQYVNVRLQLGARDQTLTVPAPAVQRGQSGPYVYLVQPDGKTVQIQPVQVGKIQDGVAVIDKGLTAGQRVVVDGQYKLKPGSSIIDGKKS